MAPIKFEENIKDRLEKRSLQPSSDSWDKLSQKLDNQDKKRNNNYVWWLGVAASIVGVIFVTSQWSSNTSVENPSTKVVNTEIKVVDDNQEIPEKVLVNEINPEEYQLSKANSKSNLNIQEKAPEKTQHDKTNEINKAVLVNGSNEQSEMYAQENTTSNDTQKTENVIINEVPFEQIKLNEVVAQIQTISGNETLVSEQDIDALLKLAETEIIANKINNKDTNMIDASDLLQDVEADLDQSFRDKVFKTLKSSYYSVKTAVADRNN